jgi:cation diffusion facilitator family transporter
MPKHSAGKLTVYVALAGNVAVAVTKFVAAALTGSSAMVSEGVHSLVDSINELLLLYGMKRAAVPPDRTHPYGHGRELYFWSFIVALMVLALGAAASFYEGINHILHPDPMRNPLLNYVVLAISFVLDGISLFVGLRAFRATKGSLGYLQAFRESKDPATFTVLFEDIAALLGVMIAAAGIAASNALNDPRLDGVASIGIGLVLLVSSLLLARETKGLLIGELAHQHVRDSIVRVANQDPDVHTANGVLTIQIGVNQIFAALSVKFHEELNTLQIETCVNRIEAAIKQAQPDITVLFVKPQSPETWQRRLEQLGAGSGHADGTTSQNREPQPPGSDKAV